MQACTYVTEAYSPVVCCFFDGVDRNFEKLPSKNLTYALSLLLGLLDASVADAKTSG